MRILWLKTELLHPVDKGGKIRTYNMLKALKRDCHITYLTLDDGTADDKARELAMLWVLNLSDGRYSLLDIAEKSALSFEKIKSAADALLQHQLLEALPRD